MNSSDIDLDEYEQIVRQLQDEIKAYGPVRRDLGAIVASLDKLCAFQFKSTQLVDQLSERMSALLSDIEHLTLSLETANNSRIENDMKALRDLEVKVGQVIDNVSQLVEAQARETRKLASERRRDSSSAFKELSNTMEATRRAQRTLTILVSIALVLAFVTAAGVVL
jgi:uncharacterized protein YukE